MTLSTTDLLGLELHRITEEQAVAHVVGELRAGRGGWIVTPNLDHLRRVQKDAEFRSLCAEADLRVADGRPLIWASALQGRRLPERVAGSDLIQSLSAAAAEADYSVFFLGGDEGTAERAAQELQRRCPRLRVAGTHYPPFGFERDPIQLAELRQALLDAQPDIIYVGLGSPKQERLIRDLRGALPNAWWMGVGISFSFLCGDVARAPRWVQKAGFEWMHRLVQEPRRLAWRYLGVGLPFAVRLFGHSLRVRFAGHRGG